MTPASLRKHAQVPDEPHGVRVAGAGRESTSLLALPPVSLIAVSREIPLTKGFVAIVDEGDFQWLSQWKWCVRGAGYAGRNGDNGHVYMHRQILSAGFGVVVDHIDGNKLNNRRANLRVATSSQNHINSAFVRGAIPYRGVYWDKRRRRFVVRIKVGKAQLWVGQFADVEEAARAYAAAAVKHYGEFAHPDVAALA